MSHRLPWGRPQPPTGWRRSLARLPIGLYRIGLGPVFGKRLLLLRHTGMVTGRPREVCLEVVEHDPVRGTWTIASGFGPQAQWYRNLRHVPNVTIQIGNTFRPVRARFLPESAGEEIMADYARRHPRAARMLCRFLAFELDSDDPGAFRRAGREIPFVRLEEVPPRTFGTGSDAPHASGCQGLADDGREK